MAALEHNNTFVMQYRPLSEHGPMYVSMKVSRMEDDERFIIIGIADVDEEVKQRLAVERVKEEQIAYARFRALAGDFLSLYSVVPETGQYHEYSATSSYKVLASPREGADYEHIEELIGKMQDHNTKALRTGGIVIACGMSKYDGDAGVALVFERADQNMYENKLDLKNRNPKNNQ